VYNYLNLTENVPEKLMRFLKVQFLLPQIYSAFTHPGLGEEMY